MHLIIGVDESCHEETFRARARGGEGGGGHDIQALDASAGCPFSVVVDCAVEVSGGQTVDNILYKFMPVFLK